MALATHEQGEAVISILFILLPLQPNNWLPIEFSQFAKVFLAKVGVPADKRTFDPIA